MRLLNIELENFGSFIKGSIDLSQINSATVSGKNGSGKSTLFVDAPLWCLFGKCRTDTDAMIKHEAQRMSVTLTFSLDGQVYKVQRTRSKATKAGKTELGFYSVEPMREVPIGGHKLTETQDAIRSVLNADYDLCATTNFLIQGKADKFSTATPSERKAILAQVLRLDEYFYLRTRANKEITVSEQRVELNLKELGPITEQMNSIQTLKAHLEGSELRLQQFGTRQIALRERIKQHGEQKGRKQQQLNAILEEKEGMVAIQKEQTDLYSSMAKCDAEIFRLQEILDKKLEIETGIETLENHVTEFEKTRTKSTALHSTIREVQERLQKAFSRQNREDQTLERVKHEVGSMEQKRQLVLSEKETQVRMIEKELSTNVERAGLLKQVPCFIELQEKCQFTIDAVQRQNVTPHLNQELIKLKERNFVEEQMPTYIQDLETRKGQLESLLVTDTPDLVMALKKEKAGHEEIMTTYEYCEDTLKEKIGSKKHFRELKTQLDGALIEVKHLEASRSQANEQINIVNKRLQEKTAKIEEETTLANWLTNAFDAEDEMASEEKQLNADLEIATKDIGATRHQIQEAEGCQGLVIQLNKEMQANQLRQQSAEQLHKYYQMIPIMIMEQAVPTLESVTNEILEKISPSGMRVRLETQKALKSSEKIAETLDILVRDVFGEKPYENYSGGERFRLDLALRFGLSQLLMHRAGSKMETLIIDEGLGSLDGDGLALLRECLGKLETSFGLILVISHVEEIQGTFETEIQVEKNAFGSQGKIL